MGLAHLRAQVIVRAEEAIDKFVSFCRRIGGNARVEEDAKFYKASCVFLSPKGLEVILNDRDGLFISLAG